MNESSIFRAVQSFSDLHRELGDAQQGAIDERLRRELARVSWMAQRQMHMLVPTQREAIAKLEAKRRKSAEMAAKNKEQIQTKQKALAAGKAPELPATEPVAAPTVDPALGKQLASELLERHHARKAVAVATTPGGVLDGWHWDRAAPTVPAAE
ncbi:hypothetical protein Mal64_04690 [Pseudobythopirellula maris]|uniref:Uncharacterized protein n=1 Tax=Pseudobythopirellula maris TaxID=2527991 RepID=A0A5C5ZS86_9BACT|nr:hypothetical protein [Pseudobythopirellula maris]TWT90086.1 hypothetical protein Mal64_04690 [Pseudobythopirellula maris]